jgi:hypothetical protein
MMPFGGGAEQRAYRTRQACLKQQLFVVTVQA